MAKHKHTTTQAPAQAPAATQPAPATPATAAPVNAALQVIYKAGKPYNVRPGTQQDNARTWAKLQEVLATGNGQASRAALQKAAEDFNHAPFVAYAIRRGWLTTAA